MINGTIDDSLGFFRFRMMRHHYFVFPTNRLLRVVFRLRYSERRKRKRNASARYDVSFVSLHQDCRIANV